MINVFIIFGMIVSVVLYSIYKLDKTTQHTNIK